MAMAMAATTKASAGATYVAKLPPPPPPPPGVLVQKATTTYDSYNGSAAARGPNLQHGHDKEQQQALDGILLLLRAAAALAAFVAVALVASCRHGDWMEFTTYQEYRYLLGASLLACLYSAAQALRSFRRMRMRYAARTSGGLLDFAGDQAVAYLLITASSAALPITIRMRSAVINIFTDAMTAAISLGFVAFAALALSAMLSGFRLSAQPY